MPNKERRDRGALEAEVLAVLAADAEPMTARQVQGQLGESTAYTTVMTTLARLHAKGALARRAAGRAFAYTIDGDSEKIDAAVTARRMHKLLDSGPDRSVALSRFVSELEPEDEQFLGELLRDLADERAQHGPT